MSRLSPLQPQLINIAILALGGQGGGVLVDWIVDLAEHAGWTAQATSVAGVAQRTGATVYYIELVEPTDGHHPVLALMPVPGDVDVLIASELMEAGRAVERGFVTPERTTVITSSHRTYAVQEKMVPGNGVADSGSVLDIVRGACRQLVIEDMQTLAVAQGSVISASLFGALAGSGALPFPVADFEAVVERSGVGVKPSLAAMRAAAALAKQPAPPNPPADPMATKPRPLPQKVLSAALQALLDRVRAEFPEPAWDWIGEGLARVVDYQDVHYGREYLNRVAKVIALDPDPADGRVAQEAACWVAVAMSYDDVIRVADLKTRAERSARIRSEVGAAGDDVVGTEEYFHPRWEEIVSLLPAGLADQLDASPRLKGFLAPRMDRGRRIQTHTLVGHLQLRFVAGLRRWRRGNRRHAQEVAHLEAWLREVESALTQDRLLGVELLRCRRLIKGYSDTHARGTSRFDQVMQAARALRGRPDAGPALGTLLQAALRDAEGQALTQQLDALRLTA